MLSSGIVEQLLLMQSMPSPDASSRRQRVQASAQGDSQPAENKADEIPKDPFEIFARVREKFNRAIKGNAQFQLTEEESKDLLSAEDVASVRKFYTDIARLGHDDAFLIYCSLMKFAMTVAVFPLDSSHRKPFFDRFIRHVLNFQKTQSDFRSKIFNASHQDAADHQRKISELNAQVDLDAIELHSVLVLEDLNLQCAFLFPGVAEGICIKKNLEYKLIFQGRNPNPIHIYYQTLLATNDFLSQLKKMAPPQPAMSVSESDEKKNSQNQIPVTFDSLLLAAGQASYTAGLREAQRILNISNANIDGIKAVKQTLAAVTAAVTQPSQVAFDKVIRCSENVNLNSSIGAEFKWSLGVVVLAIILAIYVIPTLSFYYLIASAIVDGIIGVTALGVSGNNVNQWWQNNSFARTFGVFAPGTELYEHDDCSAPKSSRSMRGRITTSLVMYDG